MQKELKTICRSCRRRSIMIVGLMARQSFSFVAIPKEKRSRMPVSVLSSDTMEEIRLLVVKNLSVVEKQRDESPKSLPRRKQVISKSSSVQELSTEQNDTKILVLTLLWLIACLSALDRVAMSVALVPLSAELDWTDTIKGSISSFFSVGYGLAILPAGLLVAKLSPRTVLAVGLTAWSLATLATPLAVESLPTLLAVRAVVGAGESVILPAIQRLLMNWATLEEKTTALAAIFSGFHAGTIAAYMVSPLVMDELGGWRGLFYLYGAFGAALVLPWCFYAQDGPNSKVPLPKSNAKNPAEEASFQRAWDEACRTVTEAPWRDMARSKGAWGMVLAHCAKNWGLYNTLAWTPTFYAEAYDIGVRDSAVLSVIPSVVGAAGGVVAGSIADAMIQRFGEDDAQVRTNVRKVFQSISFLGPAAAMAALATHIPEHPWVAQSLLVAITGLQSFNVAGYEAANQEKAGERWAGLLYSLTSFPAVIVGTCGVYVTGRILDLTSQDWSCVFGLNAAVNILGTAAFLYLFDAKKEFE